MPIYDDQFLREALVKVEDRLDYELKAVIDILRKSFPPDTDKLCFMIRVSGSINGELELTYGFGKHYYDHAPEVTGNSVHIALLEHLRRIGYEESSSSQIIPALLSASTDKDDDDLHTPIPF